MSDAFVSAFFRLTAYFAIAVVCGLALALIDHPLAPLMFAVAFFAMGALHDIYREETMALIHDLHRENKRLRAELERVSAERARHESSIRAMVAWLDQHQPDVWHRGIWDAINSALAQEPPA